MNFCGCYVLRHHLRPEQGTSSDHGEKSRVETSAGLRVEAPVWKAGCKKGLWLFKGRCLALGSVTTKDFESSNFRSLKMSIVSRDGVWGVSQAWNMPYWSARVQVPSFLPVCLAAKALGGSS